MDYGILSTGYAFNVREFIPVPGSARARLLDAAIHLFENRGFEAASVADIAAAADVTTGSLYHHFESKLGLFAVIRQEMERRIRDRMEGAFEAVGGGRSAIVSALLVGFDAAVKLKVTRILSEEPVGLDERTLQETLARLVAPQPAAYASVLLGAWRTALAAVPAGEEAAVVKDGLAWALGDSQMGG